MNILIRAETDKDIPMVEDILCSAFRTDAECKVVNAIRQNGNATISLVAEVDGNVVGHILFSPVRTHPLTPERGLGLAPLAVHPTYQSKGIGSQLIRHGLNLCKELNIDYVVILGSPKYYSRFGFEKASVKGFRNEYGVDDEFMLIRLVRLPQGGLIQYSPEFGLFSV